MAAVARRASTSRSARAFVGRVAAAQLGRVAALDAELERVELVLADRAVLDLADEVRAAGESSSMPPAPCTTYARVASSWTSASAIVRASSGE